jgi:hypothetical protein
LRSLPRLELGVDAIEQLRVDRRKNHAAQRERARLRISSPCPVQG